VKDGAAGSFYLIGVGLLLALSGAVFTWLLGTSFQRARAMDGWKETPCLILESELRERRIGAEVPTDYRLGILFGYEFENEAYTSEDYDLRGNAWVKEPQRILPLINKYSPGSEQVCWVNPSNPEQAVLKKETKAPGYSIWFPILFLVGGLGIIVKSIFSLLKKKPMQEREEEAPPVR
jgi:hypothetical protein